MQRPRAGERFKDLGGFSTPLHPSLATAAPCTHRAAGNGAPVHLPGGLRRGPRRRPGAISGAPCISTAWEPPRSPSPNPSPQGCPASLTSAGSLADSSPPAPPLLSRRRLRPASADTQTPAAQSRKQEDTRAKCACVLPPRRRDPEGGVAGRRGCLLHLRLSLSWGPEQWEGSLGFTQLRSSRTGSCEGEGGPCGGPVGLKDIFLRVDRRDPGC